MTMNEALRFLGCSADASEVEIRRAYREACRQSHPDLGGDRGTFERVHVAWRVLESTRAERTRCPDCQGTGYVTKRVNFTSVLTMLCAKCGGSGRKA
jgi:DnaJ-class molecular chaperone